MVARIAGTSRAAATSRVQRSVSRAADKSNLAEAVESPPIVGGEQLAIVIVDRRPLFRECLVRSLEPIRRSCVVFACASISEWLEAEEDYPHPALLVVCVSGRKTIDPNVRRELAQLSARKTTPPPLIISETQDLNSVANLLMSAVREHLSNDSGAQAAMKTAYLAKSFIPGKRGAPDDDGGNGPSAHLLNARQMAVLSALRQGKHIKQIAGELRIRQGTVRVHVRNIMKRLKNGGRDDVAMPAGDLLGEEDGLEVGRPSSKLHPAENRMGHAMHGNGNKLRVVVVDPQKLRQAGLARLLEDWADANGLDVRTISVPEELDLGPNCAIVVLNVGGVSVLEQDAHIWIRRIRAAVPDVPLAVLSDREDRSEILAAFGEGATGFIATSLEPSLALEALTFLLRGGSFFPLSALLEESHPAQGASAERDQAGHAAAGPTTHATTGKAPSSALLKGATAQEGKLNLLLTPRQAEVLERLREGKPNKLIARELNMTEATVKVHVRQIMRKLGAANRTQAVLCATRLAEAG